MKQQQQQQRFLIKSPPQYQAQPQQQQQQQQNASTSMITIRAPIQNQQPMNQLNQLNQNQMQPKMMTNSTPQQMMNQQGQQILPQTNKPQVANKFAANQAGGQIRNQWTTTNEHQQQPAQQQMMRPANQQQQMMQIGPNQVIMSPIVQHGGQQIAGQPTTMILQGQPHSIQQHQINQQTGQWSTAQMAGNNQQQQLIQTRPVAGGQNLQMHTIQHQPIRLVQPTTPSTPTTPQPVNRLQTPTTISSAPVPVSGGYSATPTITDPNVSTHQIRTEQVNYIISSASLQSLKSGDQSIAIANSLNSSSSASGSSLVVTSKTKSALANLLNNRLKNSTQTFASSSSLANKKDSAGSPSKTVEISNKAIDALRSLDGCSPNSNSSSNSLFDYSSLVRG